MFRMCRCTPLHVSSASEKGKTLVITEYRIHAKKPLFLDENVHAMKQHYAAKIRAVGRITGKKMRNPNSPPRNLRELQLHGA